MGRCVGLRLIVIDNALTLEQAESIINYYDENPDKLIGNWYTETFDWQFDLLTLAEQYYPEVKKRVGFESWGHMTTRPYWHVDQDELAEQNGIIEQPICSIVYYPIIRLLQGGQFITETEVIEPKTNRAIIFAPDIPHSVNPWQGDRMSVAINPWAFVPYTYRHK